MKHPGVPTISPACSERWSGQTHLLILRSDRAFFPTVTWLPPTCMSRVSWQTQHLWPQILLTLLPAAVFSPSRNCLLGSQSSLDKEPGAPGSTYAKSPRLSSRCLFQLLTSRYFSLLDILFSPLFACLTHVWRCKCSKWRLVHIWEDSSSLPLYIHKNVRYCTMKSTQYTSSLKA